MANVQYVSDVIMFSFVIVSIPIYITVVFTLLKYRSDLKSSYFSLFISAGIADLVATFHKYLTRHIPKLIWGTDLIGNVWLATFHRMGFWSLYFTQIIGVFWLSANRMTALAWPFKHESLWTPCRIKLAIASQWILPLGFSLPMFHPRCRSTFSNDILPVYNNTEIYDIYSTIDIVLEPGFFMPSFILFYSIAFWKARKHARKIVPSRNSKILQSESKKKAERNLAISGAILSSIYIMMCILIILVQFPIETGLLVFMFYPLSDLFTMCNPYLLLVFSSKFRPYFKAVVMCRKPQNIKKSSSHKANNKV